MLDAPDGAEVLVLEGSFEADGERCESLSWTRLPVGSELRATAGPQECTAWVKTGHLRHVALLPATAQMAGA